jgi:SEC-C motif-containing protein
MRSRYTAYVLRRADYLLATWDPATRPDALNLESDRTEWIGLRILGCVAGGPSDSEGRVRFVASFRQRGTEHELREDSRFRREDGRWLYVDGDTATRGVPAVAAAKTDRNAPCPCGSGRKYKRCCGA